ncbi:23S ribosomal RNA [Ruminococcus albus SY3]|uniref:23S ribosomal RNA n=1 Tax=Ruminococcus albus SY3 TaxID=1341156 RepID=A0A011VTW1_RUMAL|nr:methyltransferase domain-containing protein [Ruminococcus albus]EXM38023.1 23S ribosomal RNA [Ruminococcus albus SY3]
MYICPVCRKKLNKIENTWKCVNGHSFDIARKGHVNLLTTAKHNPKTAGDNADMVKARTEFLDKGYYRPLAEKIREIASAELQEIKNPIIIDSGCGEGFYTVELSKLEKADIYGIDISKHAVAHCMTRVHQASVNNCEFAVASSFDLPFANNSADAVISVFAPVCNDEYARVLKKGGKLIVVSPSPRHLFELKAAVYDKPYENKPNDYHLDRFVGDNEIVFEYTAELSSQKDIFDLFMMTPYFYKTSEEGISRLKALDSINVNCGFVIQVYKRK